jgi:hypothetical protein
LMKCQSWVDDCLFLCTSDDVIESKNALMRYFECDNIGYAEEYVGCRITMKDKEAKFLQPVLLRSLVDEFGATDKGFKLLHLQDKLCKS